MREILTRASRIGRKKVHLVDQTLRRVSLSLLGSSNSLDRVDFLTPKESRFDTPVRYVTDVHTSTFIDFHARSREGRTLIEAFRNSLAYQPTSLSLSLAFKAYELYPWWKKKKRKERFSRILTCSIDEQGDESVSIRVSNFFSSFSSPLLFSLPVKYHSIFFDTFPRIYFSRTSETKLKVSPIFRKKENK